MSPSYWQIHAKRPDYRCDIAVIGGGIVGCSAAFWLSRYLPDRPVAILEAGLLASGASGRNAGFLLQGASSDYFKDYMSFGADKARRLLRFTRENRDLLFLEIGTSAQLESNGSLVVAGSEEEDQRLQQAVGRLRADGTPSVYFPPDETNRRIVARGFLGSLYVPSDGVMNPVSLVTSIAKQSEAAVLEHHPVRYVGFDDGGVIIETASQTVRAKQVLVTVNAWLPTLFPELGGYVRQVRAQMLSSTPMAKRWIDVTIYSHDGFYYVRQTRSGLLLAGGARHLHEDQEVGLDMTTTPSVQAAIEAYLRRHFPDCGSMQVDLRWSGIMGFSPDMLPAYGSLPAIPNGLWAAGFSGHGMSYGFRFGKMLAEIMAGCPDVEGADLFTADRFASTVAAAAAC